MKPIISADGHGSFWANFPDGRMLYFAPRREEWVEITPRRLATEEEISKLPAVEKVKEEAPLFGGMEANL